MGAAVAVAVLTGLAAGKLVLGPGWLSALQRVSDVALHALLALVGMQLGMSREAWRGMVRAGPGVLLVPGLVAVGSVAGAAAAGLLLGLPARLGAAVGAGFGWYSLSAVLLSRLVDPAAGALAFLCNVLRELLTLLLAFPLARRFGPLAPVAAGGATAMDSTLPMISRAAGPQAAAVGFLSGVVLTAAAPPLIALLAGR